MYNVRRDSPKHMSPCEIKKLFRNYILIIVILIIPFIIATSRCINDIVV